jgi:hypothetical protein
MWHGLVPWSTLDSPGHMHEVVAGDLFHPELESVPEQTWSSAGFLTAAVQGLLGIEIHAASRTIVFAPHLPAIWDELDIKRLRVGSSLLDLHMTENGAALALQVNNSGPPVSIDFGPQMPLGAQFLGAEVNGAPAPATLMKTAQDQHAKLTISAGSGVTRAVVRYSGGVRIAPVGVAPQVGDRSINVKLVSASWGSGDVLKLKAYVADPAHAAIDLFTPMKVAAVQGAAVSQIGNGQYRLQLNVPPKTRPAVYIPVEVTAKLEDAVGIK